MTTCLVIISLLAACAYSQNQDVFNYDCRRLNDCFDESVCNPDSTCTCPEFYTGDTCYQYTAGGPCITENLCDNGGTCFVDISGVERCDCPVGFLGDSCGIERAVVICTGTSMNIALNFPDTYEGVVKLYDEAADIPTVCNFGETTAGNINTWTLDIKLEKDTDATDCGKNFVTEEEQAGEKTYNARVLTQYFPNVVSGVDEVINVTCVHPESGVAFHAEIASVGISVGDLTVVDKNDTYNPMEIRILNKNKEDFAADEVLVVGDTFYIYVYLVDTSVYNSIRIDSVVANDTEATPQVFQLLKDDCPTKRGMMAVKLQEEAEVNVDGILRTAGVLLEMTAFKFVESDNVGFTIESTRCRTPTDCQKPTLQECQDIIKAAEVAETETNTDGTGETNNDGTGGTNTDGTEGTNTDGTAGTNTDGTAGTNTDGTAGTNTDGTAGTNNDGTAGTNNDGTAGTNNDGTAGTAGTNNDGTAGTNNDGTAGTNNDGTAGTNNDGTAGTNNDGTAGTNTDGTAGTNTDGTGTNTDNTGTGDGTGTARRRRAADDDKRTLSTVVRVRGPHGYSSDANKGDQVGTSVETCLAKSEILSAMIVLGVLACLLLIACCVLALCLLKRKTKSDSQASSHYYGNERFQIPRAHVNDAYRDL